MYIITLNNQTLERIESSNSVASWSLYRTEEIALHIHVREREPRIVGARASLLNHPSGITLVSGRATPTETSERLPEFFLKSIKSLGKNTPLLVPRLSIEDSPSSPALGKIPQEYKERLAEAITLLTSKPLEGYEDLQEKLLKELDRL